MQKLERELTSAELNNFLAIASPEEEKKEEIRRLTQYSFKKKL